MPTADVESVSWLRFAFASITVVSLMALLAWGLKQLSLRGWLVPNTGTSKLTLLSSLPLDGRRRLVIAQCDDVEYHLLLGPNNDLLLSQKKVVPQSAAPAPSSATVKS